MNKQIAKQALMSNANACYNAVKENGWQSEMLKESIDNIVDAIESDHPKVKLPREVGEELDTWIANNQDGYGGRISDLCGSLWDQIQELSATATFANKSEENYFKVIDAYRYGWEAEPEAKWYVQTPKEWWEDKNKPEYVDLDSMGISDGLKCKEYAAQFTRAELKHYHFDSDIFTIVQVEDKK